MKAGSLYVSSEDETKEKLFYVRYILFVDCVQQLETCLVPKKSPAVCLDRKSRNRNV